ncbi:hypothetical protein [Streptococcus merionis]|uniref:Uncharacterized protein n=1 Tax=Streptococcus merionis TaxID=400065 RepID=A0A239SYV5_9STRE|nr:hypothetical protein [Streptococcus merionis]SNU90442.1 Uncharacterised protein [Streptococcus merionis]
MKKATVILLVVGISILTLFEFVKPSIEKSSNNKFITFGKVDFSDDDDYEYDESEDYEYESDETNWFEDFIKNHKTPFSKTIQK